MLSNISRSLGPILGYLKDLGPFLLAIVVAVAALWFQRWQVRLAKQKLRHDLYDRRFAIYMAFQDLLMALPEKSDDEIKILFRRACVARFEAPFLLNDPTVEAYLEGLSKEISDDVVGKIVFHDAVRGDVLLMKDPHVSQEFARRMSGLGTAKILIPERHYRELAQQFSKVLKVTDFWK